MLEEPPDKLHTQTAAGDPPRVITTARRSKPKPIVRTIIPAQKRNRVAPHDYACEAVPSCGEPHQPATHSQTAQEGASEQNDGAGVECLHDRASGPQAKYPRHSSGTHNLSRSKRHGVGEERLQSARRKAQGPKESTAGAAIEEHFASDQHELGTSKACPLSQITSEISETSAGPSETSSRPSAPLKEIHVGASEGMSQSILKTSLSSARAAGAAHVPNSRLSSRDVRHTSLLSQDVPTTPDDGATVHPRSKILQDRRLLGRRMSPFMGDCVQFVDQNLNDESDTSESRDNAEHRVRESVAKSKALSKDALNDKLSPVELAVTGISLGSRGLLQQQRTAMLSSISDGAHKPSFDLTMRGCGSTPVYIDLTKDSSDTSDAEESGRDGAVNKRGQAQSEVFDSREATIVGSSSVSSAIENGFPYICKIPRAKQIKAQGTGKHLRNKQGKKRLRSKQAKRYLRSKQRERYPQSKQGKENGKLFARSNPAIHATREICAVSFEQQTSRKAWFGQAARRQQWAQQQDALLLLCTEPQPQPWMYPRHRDFGMSLRIQQKLARGMKR